MSDQNHESLFLTADKFKLPPNWAGWEVGQPDNSGVEEHHVRSLIRDDGKWVSGNLWDLNEDGEMHNGLMITVCERNVPGEYIFHETVMSGQECAHKCSGWMFGECENFCGRGGYCFGDPHYRYDELNQTEKLEIEKSYQCRNGNKINFI